MTEDEHDRLVESVLAMNAIQARAHGDVVEERKALDALALLERQ